MKWYQLGIQLDFESCDLDIIKENNCGDIEKAKLDLFSKWIQSNKEASWAKLIVALKQLKLYQLSNNILIEYGGGMLCGGLPKVIYIYIYREAEI